MSDNRTPNPPVKTLPDQLRQARERLSLSQEEVAGELGIPRSAVSDIETGKREVSASELFTLVRLFGSSIDELLGLAQPQADEELLMLRANAVSVPVRSRLSHFVELVAMYSQLEEWAGEKNTSDLRMPNSILSTFEQAQRLADEERSRLELGVTPGCQLLETLEERIGVKVIFLSLPDDLSGAALNSPTHGPAILVNSSHPYGRCVFTLAHEYFHLLTQDRIAASAGPRAAHICTVDADGKKDRADQLADQFAGELLLPRQHFFDTIKRLQQPDKTLETLDLIGVADYFAVSVLSVFMRMAALRMLPYEVAKREYDHPEIRNAIASRRGHGRQFRSTRFRRLAVRAYVDGHISRSRLAELIEVNVADIGEEVKRFGGEQAGHGIKLSLSR